MSTDERPISAALSSSEESCRSQSDPPSIRLLVASDDELAETAARWLVDTLLQEAERTGGDIAVALAGGSTPRPVYETLASEPFRSELPWNRIHWFWGDERMVEHDDPRSNYGMARAALFDRLGLDEERLHPVPVDGGAGEAAQAYARKLQTFAEGREGPLFAVSLLGLGTDGHTASLFPGDGALGAEGLAAPVEDAADEERVTLTAAALSDSRHVAFLVSGAEKLAVVRSLLLGDPEVVANRIRGRESTVCLADRSAAEAPDQ